MSAYCLEGAPEWSVQPVNSRLVSVQGMGGARVTPTLGPPLLLHYAQPAQLGSPHCHVRLHFGITQYLRLSTMIAPHLTIYVSRHRPKTWVGCGGIVMVAMVAYTLK